MQLNLTQRGLYRELIDKAYKHGNKVPVKLNVWSRLWAVDVDDLTSMIDLLSELKLITLEPDGSYISVPSVKKRLDIYEVKSKAGSKGGKISASAQAPAQAPARVVAQANSNSNSNSNSNMNEDFPQSLELLVQEAIGIHKSVTEWKIINHRQWKGNLDKVDHFVREVAKKGGNPLVKKLISQINGYINYKFAVPGSKCSLDSWISKKCFEENWEEKYQESISQTGFGGKKVVIKFKPPTKQEVIDYFKENGYKPEVGAEAWEYYEAGDWKDQKGDKVKSWKQKMRGVWFRDKNKDVKTTIEDQQKFQLKGYE